LKYHSNREPILFIINPNSGPARLNKSLLTVKIERFVDRVQYEPIICFTQKPGDANELVKIYHKEGVKKMVAVGGDGTVNEVARAVAGKKGLILGIIPAGSGNGLARHLEIPIQIRRAITVINKPRIVKIDYATMNDVPFFCTCGVGFDALVGNRFAKSEVRGFFSYLATAFKEYFLYKPRNYTISTKDSKQHTRAFLVTIANASQYGNNAFISPDADIQDGLLDVVILSPFPYLKAIGLGFHLFSKSIYRSRYHTTFRTKKLVIRRKKPGEVHFDGEPGWMKKKIYIECFHKGLHVMVPEKSVLN
jgi:diacylglycerol kinase (ATP)